MGELDARRQSALRDFDALIATLEGLDAAGWSADVPCEGWTVRHLAAHLTESVPFLENRLAEMLAARHAAPAASGVVTVDASAPPEAMIATLRTVREGIASQLGAITEDDLAPDPNANGGFLSPSIDLYLDLAVFETAIHRNDLETALGEADAPISPEGMAAIDAVLGSNMVGFAEMTQARPEARLSITFDGATIGHTLTWDGNAWSGEPPVAGGKARIAGSDAALTRFICGRIPVDSPLLTVEGDIDIARRFKTFVPGP